jgi:hypothetical protein
LSLHFFSPCPLGSSHRNFTQEQIKCSLSDWNGDAKYKIIHSQALIVQDGTLASLYGVSWSHTYRHTVVLLWTSDQPVAKYKITLLNRMRKVNAELH